MANSVQDLMLQSLLKAGRAAEQITAAVDRAKAYTELAKACAMAIQTKEKDTVIEMPVAETPKEMPKTAKRSTKKAATAAPATEEEKAEEPAVKEESVAEEQPVAEEQSQQESVPESKQEESAQQSEEQPKAQEKTPEELEAEEYDFTDEWTPKACEIMAAEIEEIQRYFNMFQDDPAAFNEMVSAATEGVSTDIDTITPLNIRIVLQYIKNLEADSSGGEER